MLLSVIHLLDASAKIIPIYMNVGIDEMDESMQGRIECMYALMGE